MRKRKKDIISTVILVIMMLVGLSVMLYPKFSDWWNSRVQSKAIANYDTAVAELDTDTLDRMRQEAHEFNKRLADMSSPLLRTDELRDYDKILNIGGTGIMGYITIPVIRVELPIYHGTDADVLNVAAGHLKGSSFPVGGRSTHAVISAHRGLPSAKLFSDLDDIVVGDTFTITVLDRIYTYEVEEIRTILPEELENLAIVPEKDYVTLMTCTPYGINSHRLLLRSRRIATVTEEEEEEEYSVLVMADGVQVDTLVVVFGICAPLVIILLCVWTASGRKSSLKLLLDDPLSILREQKDGG